MKLRGAMQGPQAMRLLPSGLNPKVKEAVAEATGVVVPIAEPSEAPLPHAPAASKRAMPRHHAGAVASPSTQRDPGASVRTSASPPRRRNPERAAGVAADDADTGFELTDRPEVLPVVLLGLFATPWQLLRCRTLHKASSEFRLLYQGCSQLHACQAPNPVLFDA
jgi:hypothetical protein